MTHRCAQCGGRFRRVSRDRILAKKYCSQSCQRDALRSRAKDRAERKPRSCPGCGSRFVARQFTGRQWQKFCTPACHRAEAAKNQFRLIRCAECDREVVKLTAQAKRATTHYCSVDCRTKHFRAEHHPMHRPESFLDSKRRGGVSRWKAIAAQTRNRDGHTCRRCRRRHLPTERQFPVDHVIPWRCFEDKDQANDLSNLVTLCHSCHTWKTTTIERQYLKGDRIGLEQFKKACALA